VSEPGSAERYGDESPLGYMQATIVRSVMARAAPSRDSRTITLLVAGTDVIEVAERESAVLVMFDDPNPKSSGEQVLGWIAASSLELRPRHRCTRPQVEFVSVPGSFCAQPCVDSHDCGADEACVPGGGAVARERRTAGTFAYCIAK
jgi:hypothetical protein